MCSMYGQSWMDLNLTPPRVAWQMLRTLRSAPPGWVGRGRRRAVFAAAMEQAEQLFGAAADVGPATRPLLAFYGLSQAGRAIAAASHATAWELWDAASAGFAATARGDGNVFIGPSFRGAGSVFGRIEGPILRFKGNPILQRFEDAW
jgi:hypothetical protein